MRVRVAAIQMSSVPDRDANLAAAAVHIRAAAEVGSRFVSLPENFSYLGRPEDKKQIAEDLDRSPSLDFLREQARRHEIHLIGGSIPLKTSDPERVSNSCFAIGPAGDVLARYDKLHLFDVSIDRENTHRESDHVVPGNSVVTFSAEGLTVGLTICYDVRFPELYRRIASEGADVVFVPAAFTVPTGRAHWEVLLRARAIENLCYVVAPAQVGEHVPGRTTYGHSMIVDPWGNVKAEETNRPGVIWADLDTSEIASARARLPVLEHRRADLFPS